MEANQEKPVQTRKRSRLQLTYHEDEPTVKKIIIQQRDNATITLDVVRKEKKQKSKIEHQRTTKRIREQKNTESKGKNIQQTHELQQRKQKKEDGHEGQLKTSKKHKRKTKQSTTNHQPINDNNQQNEKSQEIVLQKKQSLKKLKHAEPLPNKQQEKCQSAKKEKQQQEFRVSSTIKSKKKKAKSQIKNLQQYQNQRRRSESSISAETQLEQPNNQPINNAIKTEPIQPFYTEQQPSNPNSKTDKSQSKQKNKQKSTPQRSQSINILNRQMAKQCITKKSNFYLRKQDCLKQGLPVGRGSRKALQLIESQRRKQRNQKSLKNKVLREKVRQLQIGKSPKDIIQSERNETLKDDIKEQYDSDWQTKKEPVQTTKTSRRGQTPRKKKNDCTTEQSIKIISAFSEDAGNYRGMVKDLGFTLTKIRRHLRMLFQRCLQIITQKVLESGRKIKDWQILEKRQIIRQLHRIRCSNRLLSELNVEFRQKFMRLMISYNDPSITLTETDYNYLYRKIQAFVRGFCSIGNAKKKSDLKLEQKQVGLENRQPLLEGGYIMDKNRVKKQIKLEAKIEEPEQKKTDQDKIMNEWTEEEEKYLGKLYMENQNNPDAIIEYLRLKFGSKNRWKDFQILGRKTDHLVKLGLYKLQQLTSKPYNRQEKYRQDEQKTKLKGQSKLIDASEVHTDVNSLDILTQFIYNNKKAANKTDESHQNGVFKNISLLERRIFGHVQSFKARCALVNLLIEKFPPQQSIDTAIHVTQQFIAYAEDWQKKNSIIRLRRSNVKSYQQRQGNKSHFSFADEETDFNANKFDEIIQDLVQFSNQAPSQQFYLKQSIEANMDSAQLADE